MVSFKSFITAAALSGIAFALPRPQDDSALGIEVAVSAPNGQPLTDSVELASQLSREAATATTNPDAQPTPVQPDNQNGQYGANQYPNQPPPNEHAAATTSAWVSYSTPSYGSGSANWGGSGYDDCVNQCIASYGSPAAPYYAPTSTAGHSGPTGTGATHTVIVAPTQGVLRYVPFAVNASVGDTIEFHWGANRHTVTHSSALAPCNRTEEEPFASGIQNATFIYTQVVNDTNPVYFHCAVTGHCQKGMFGIINPASGGDNTIGTSMQDIAASNPDVSAYASYVRTQTQGNEGAGRWGTNIDIGALPDWAQPMAAVNVLYTRDFLANNKEVLREDGSVDLSSASSTPLMFPEDISAAINNAGASPAPAPASSAAPSAQSSAATPSGTPVANAGTTGNSANVTSGALSLSSSRILVGAAVVFATFFAL